MRVLSLHLIQIQSVTFQYDQFAIIVRNICKAPSKLIHPFNLSIRGQLRVAHQSHHYNIAAFNLIKLIDLMSEQHIEGEDRSISPNNALDKIIKLVRKNSNFEYQDPVYKKTIKLAYSLPTPDAPPLEHLLKIFWRNISYYYFKRIELSEIKRLQHFLSISNLHSQPLLPFDQNLEFWEEIEGTFSPEYLARFGASTDGMEDYRNWIAHLRLHWDCRHYSANDARKMSLQSRNIPKQDFLRHEWRLLQRLIPQKMEEESEVDEQIARLEQELLEVAPTNKQLLEPILACVKKELAEDGVTHCINQTTDEAYYRNAFMGGSTTNIGLRLIDKIEVQLRYLEYTILKLEKNQVAESMAKIVRLERGKGQVRFVVAFQGGMNLRAVHMTEAELMDLNSVRQYSLIKFYNTSLKSTYSFICQNFYGFKEIFDSRLSFCRLKDKNILEEIKRNSQEPPNSKAAKQFSRFDICHHCKLLYPDTLLTTCAYRSSQHGIPISPMQYHDAYVSQILKSEQPKAWRAGVKHRNAYLSYEKRDQEFICARKFCKYCLKQNYEDNLPQKKAGLCPYCQGVCFCTRCARNEMIVRLKSLCLLMGGDMNALASRSLLHKLGLNSQEGGGNRKKGRQMKSIRKQSCAPSKMHEKMQEIRFHLEDLRILCDLVKRREKQKMKLLEVQREKFRGMLEISSGLDFSPLEQDTEQTDRKTEQENRKISNMSKRLKRMIS